MTALLDTAPARGGVEDCSPTALADAVREARAAEVAAGIEVLRLAVAWADAHPALEEDGRPVVVPRVAGEVWAAHFVGIDPEEHREGIGERPSWAGLPRLSWDAEAGFAVTAGMSTRAGSALIRDALIAPRAPTAGTVLLRRLVNETMVRLYPDVVAVRSWQDLERRYVHLDRDHLGHTGLAGMDIRADYADLDDLDKVLTELAQRLPALDPDARRETLDQRRARALGVLADPARAHRILTADTEEPVRAAPRRRSTTLILRISDLALLGVDDDAGTIENGPRAGAAVLAETIAAWCGRPTSDLTVLPVLDPEDHRSGSGYAAPATLKRHLVERDRHCLFPFCERPAHTCDVDHLVPHAAGGPTCSCNTIALCRHHQNAPTKSLRGRWLKTHAGYQASLVEPGLVWWTTPWGHHFAVNTHGTTPLTTGIRRAPPRPVCLQ